MERPWLVQPGNLGSCETARLNGRDRLGLVHIFSIAAGVQATSQLVNDGIWNGQLSGHGLANPGDRVPRLQALRQSRQAAYRTDFRFEQNLMLPVMKELDLRATFRIGAQIGR